MSGVINKVKDVLHKDKDTTHNDSTGHSSLDRNNDGRVDTHDVTRQQSGGLAGSHSTGHGTANPLDRNDDGRVGAGDLTGHGSNAGLTGHNTTHGSTEHRTPGVGAGSVTGQHQSTGGLSSHSTTGHGVGNDAFAGAGSYKAEGPHQTHTANVLDPHVQGGAQSGLSHGTTGHSSVAGHSGAGNLNSGAQGYSNVSGAQSGLSHGSTANPVTSGLDRNNDGRINAGDLAPGAHGHSSNVGGAGHTATSGVGHNASGAYGQTTNNPLDRNNDGRTNARDLAPGAHGHSTGSGVGHTGAEARDAHSHGHPSQGHTANPLDRNNDGKVDSHDLKSKGNHPSGSQGTQVISGVKQGNELEHRSGESGDLPKALTEPYSKAEPHHGSGLGPAHTTDRGETRASGTVKDKLDPTTDSDRDGKAGVMD